MKYLFVIPALLLVLVTGAIFGLRASLPVLEGQEPLAGLGMPVEVARDALGIPTVRGHSRIDVARHLFYRVQPDKCSNWSQPGRVTERNG